MSRRSVRPWPATSAGAEPTFASCERSAGRPIPPPKSSRSATMHHLRPTRRQLLQGTGGLVITFALGSALKRSGEAQQRAEPSDPYTVKLPDDQTIESILTRDVRGQVDSWLSISQKGDVAIFVGKVELGTGVMTAFAQIAAEELDVPFVRVTVIQGDTDLTPDQGYTAGSMSIQVAKPVLQDRFGDLN